MRITRLAAALVAAAITATTLASCSDDEGSTDAPVLSVTIEGADVRPNAQAIDLASGEELEVEVESDRAGELHVHAKPEQYLEFDAGTTHATLVITTPGSVEVEDHETGAVVALLQVR